jgi:hypothetical protein
MERYSRSVVRKNQYCQNVLPSLVNRFNVIPIKIPASYFVDIKKWILTFIREGKRSRTFNTVSENKVGGLMLSDFKTYYKATVINAVWWLVKEQIDQWDRIENPETEPCKIQSTGHLQRSKGNTIEQIHSFQQMMLEQLDIHMQK